MQDRLRNLGQYKPTRRELLIGAGAIAATSLLNRCYLDTTQPRPTPTPTSTPDVTIKKEKTMDELLQEILNIRPFTDERVLREHEYVGRIENNPTLQDIDRGFWVATDPLVRASLLDLRWELRKKGYEKLAKIPEDKKGWVLSQNVHPEDLGISTDAYSRALKIMATLNENGKLRFDRKFEYPEEGMINPGGMAMLIDRETGGTSFLNVRYGFSHIGQGIALDEINEEEFPGGKAAVFELAKIVSRKTGLNIVAENIVGSKKGNAKSGGATGPIEFMPPNSVKYKNFILANTGEDLNPFDLTDATTMAYVFLGHHERVENGVRYGYWRGHPEDIEAALAKWFGDYTHARSIRLKAEDFYATFIGSGKYPF